MFTKKTIFRMFSILLVVLMMSGIASARPLEAPLGTGFTYQGKLTDGGTPANGVYDFEFKLYNALSGGSPVGGTVPQGDVTVTNGLFTVLLDFGNVFDGTALYLEIGVRPGASTDAYTALPPRQALTATPYAIYASKAPWGGLSGVPAGFADGTDNNTLYTAGSGLALGGNQFSVTGAPWSGLSGMPGGFSDGVDNNTLYTAGSGLALVGNQFSVTGAPWSGLSGVPGGFSDGVDNDTTYTAGDGLELVGTQFKGKGTSTQNVVIVAKEGGDFTTITDALNSITTASSSNCFLIYVAPGVYNESVTMKQFVDIEGAGELTTKITSNGSTLWGASSAELRFLTVESTGGSTYAIAIINEYASPHLTHVTAYVTGGTYNYGVLNRISSSPTMTNVTVTATGNIGDGTYNYGVYNNDSYPTMTNVTASSWGGTKSYGVYNDQGGANIYNSAIKAGFGTENYGIFNNSPSAVWSVVVNNSQIWGSTNSIWNDAGFHTYVSASQLSGGAVVSIGPVKCIGVYDENYNSAGYTVCP